jgi:hypothetical protein
MGGMSSMDRKKRVCEVGWCIHVCEMLSCGVERVVVDAMLVRPGLQLML